MRNEPACIFNCPVTFSSVQSQTQLNVVLSSFVSALGSQRGFNKRGVLKTKASNMSKLQLILEAKNDCIEQNEIYLSQKTKVFIYSSAQNVQ